MTTDGDTRPVLDPVERLSELLFGIVMVLTFTSSMGVAAGGRAEVRTTLLEALSCNVAWGIVDGVMFVLTNLIGRAHGRATLQAVRDATDPAVAGATIADALPPVVASVLQPDDLERMRRRLVQVPVPSRPVWMTADDVRGAVEIFLLVVASTFPVAVPFLLIHEPWLALRCSNAVAVAMLFALGFSLGRYTGVSPVRLGLVMAGIGAALAGVAIALGG